jgi:hypothetical protein
MTITTHELRCNDEDEFEAVRDGKKTHEIRRSWGFKVGDRILLQEYGTDYTGRDVLVDITYISKTMSYKLYPVDLVIMSITIARCSECELELKVKNGRMCWGCEGRLNPAI